ARQPKRRTMGSSAAKEEQSTKPAKAGEAPLVRDGRSLMSTRYEISVVSSDETRARAAIRAALDEVERLGIVLSEWRPDSEVSQINRAAGERPVHVGPDTLANIRTALQIAEWTNGAYDITWAALRDFYLFQRGKEQVPDLAEVRRRLPLVNW